MYCKTCGNFFQPTPDEEKLIVTGGLDVLCNGCATADWKERSKNKGVPAPIQPGTGYKHGDGTQLYHAEWLDAQGLRVAFVAMPPIPRRATSSPLRKERKQDIHVFVMTESTGQNRRSTPRTQLYTNLDTFRKLRQPLKIEKIPNYDDPYTGTSLLRFDPADVADIEREEGLVRIHLRDGGHVLLRYR